MIPLQFCFAFMFSILPRLCFCFKMLSIDTHATISIMNQFHVHHRCHRIENLCCSWSFETFVFQTAWEMFLPTLPSVALKNGCYASKTVLCFLSMCSFHTKTQAPTYLWIKKSSRTVFHTYYSLQYASILAFCKLLLMLSPPEAYKRWHGRYLHPCSHSSDSLFWFYGFLVKNIWLTVGYKINSLCCKSLINAKERTKALTLRKTNQISKVRP